jgi:hypothetical protein
MHKEKRWLSHEEILHLGRALIAIFALIEAAGHLAYLIPSTMPSSFPAHTGNTTPVTSNVITSLPANQIASQSSSRVGLAGMAFSETQFWFAVEVIAYALIAVVFLMGLRTWYVIANLFNIFNIGIYILSGFFAIPGITSFAFGSRFHFFAGLSTINIIFFSWIAILILGLILLKYDPGSKLDELLVTRKER